MDFTEPVNAVYVMRLSSLYVKINNEIELHTSKFLREPAFKIIKDKTLWGYWNPSDRVLALNIKLFTHYEDAAVERVLRHEMAHQIVSEIFEMGCRGVSHGEAWERACKVVNTPPSRCDSHELMSGLKGKSEDKIVNKIRKIMELAADGNFEEEADTALRKAQELMLRYNISMQDVSGTESVFVKRAFGGNYSAFPVWMFALGNFLNEFYGVKCIQSWGPKCYTANGRCKTSKRLELFGEPDRLDIAEYVGHALINQGKILWMNYKKEHNSRMKTDENYRLNNQEEKFCRQTGGYKLVTNRLSERSFMEGLISGYVGKLRKSQLEVKSRIEAEDGAIVPVYNQKLLKEMHGTAYPNLRTSRGTSSSGAGRSAGHSAGSSMNIGAGVTSSGNNGRFLN